MNTFTKLNASEECVVHIEAVLTLEPLRTDGPDALNTDGVKGIIHARLCEIETVSENAFHEGTARKADDVFACAAAERENCDAIPRIGQLIRAVFAIEFADSPNCRRVEVQPPHTLKLERPADAVLVYDFLVKRHFVHVPSPAQL